MKGEVKLEQMIFLCQLENGKVYMRIMRLTFIQNFKDFIDGLQTKKVI